MEATNLSQREAIYRFYESLAMKNTERISEIFAEDSTLYWGPYEFKGREAILNWSHELFELFPFISFKEKTLDIDGAKAKHEFMIAFLTPQGRKGWLPCIADYDFEDGSIKLLKIQLLHGFLAVDKDEVERVKPSSSNPR